jgi:hypothetical protein
MGHVYNIPEREPAVAVLKGERLRIIASARTSAGKRASKQRRQCQNQKVWVAA